MKNQKTLADAVALHQNGQLKAAIELYQKILKSEPNNFDALHMLGAAQLQKGDVSKAIENLRLAVKAKTESAPAHYNLGRALAERKDHAAAKARFQTALKLNPNMLDALINLGHCERELGNFKEHLLCHEKALAMSPNEPELLYNLANAWKVLGHKEKAINFYELALVLKPDYAEALYNRGIVELEQGLADTAIEHLKKALQAKWEYFEAWTELGNALVVKKRYADAIESFDQALKLNNEYPGSLYGKGNALCQNKDFQAGLTLQKKALEHKPGTPYWLGTFVQNLMQACDWKELRQYSAELTKKALPNPLLTSTWTLCSLPVSRNTLLEHTKKAYELSKPKEDECLPTLTAVKREKVRVAYFSSDFHSHPVGFLIGELIELHNRGQFDIIGFYLGKSFKDPVYENLKATFDEFYDVAEMGYKALAEFARSKQIDIAIDLNGLTGDARSQSFYLRMAPVQVNFLGYPGTMGAPEYDYIIADHTLIPPEHEDGYSEKIARMPDSFFINNRHRKISDKPMQRADHGLPDNAFVFCCLNNAYKIAPEVFESWMRIMKACPNTVLWLGVSNPAMKENLVKEAKLKDIAPSRIVFAERVADMSEHLARQRLADLFLDTPFYNAHTTSADALWAGLPVLTCEGSTFSSRVAASQLVAAGLPELITKTVAEYEEKAIRFALAPEELIAIRRRLEADIHSCALFDTTKYAQGLEQLLLQMQALALVNEAPRNLQVA